MCRRGVARQEENRKTIEKVHGCNEGGHADSEADDPPNKTS